MAGLDESVQTRQDNLRESRRLERRSVACVRPNLVRLASMQWMPRDDSVQSADHGQTNHLSPFREKNR